MHMEHVANLLLRVGKINLYRENIHQSSFFFKGANGERRANAVLPSKPCQKCTNRAKNVHLTK